VSAGRPYLLPRGGTIDRHCHARAYATIVVRGGYEEAGDAGRHQVRAGDVLVHAAFSAHRDFVADRTTEVIDLPILLPVTLPARGRLADVDAVAQLAERDAGAAAALLLDRLEPGEPGEADPADMLAAALAEGQTAPIGAWGARLGLARETLSRQFRRLYGIDAAAYRVEARARLAWRQVVGTSAPLAEIAAATGHADQAHMTRAIHALTGLPPGAWRRVTSLQDRSAAAA